MQTCKCHGTTTPFYDNLRFLFTSGQLSEAKPKNFRCRSLNYGPTNGQLICELYVSEVQEGVNCQTMIPHSGIILSSAFGCLPQRLIVTGLYVKEGVFQIDNQGTGRFLSIFLAQKGTRMDLCLLFSTGKNSLMDKNVLFLHRYTYATKCSVGCQATCRNSEIGR